MWWLASGHGRPACRPSLAAAGAAAAMVAHHHPKPARVLCRPRPSSCSRASGGGWASDSGSTAIGLGSHRKSHAPENYRVLLGSTQLFEHTQHTLEMSVSQIVMHPDFEKLHPFGSDIAMLQLLFPVNFTSYIIPACLPAPGLQLLSNASCWITGWGMLNEETPLPTPFHLQEAKVGLIENQFCNLVYGHRLSKNFSVYEEMLCVGDFSTGKAICHPQGPDPPFG